jgi:hypothetical protein
VSLGHQQRVFTRKNHRIVPGGGAGETEQGSNRGSREQGSNRIFARSRGQQGSNRIQV